MNRKKKILFVMNTLGRAGAERALIALMRLLYKEKYRLCLYVLIPRGEIFREVPEYVHILNYKTDSRSVLSTGGKIFVAGRIVRAAVRGKSMKKAAVRLWNVWKQGKNQVRKQKIEKILRRIIADGAAPLPGEYDVAVAYLEGPATWFVAEKVQARKKIAFLHVDYSQAGYTRELDCGCYKTFKRIFAVSGEVRKNFLKVYPEYAAKTGLFYNIIDRERIKMLAAEPGGFTDHFDGIRILSVGRLYYQKGFDIAVRTAAILKKRGYCFRWYVLGEGEEKRKLFRLIKEEKLEGTFFLSGVAENPYPYFRDADIYVCTSRFEGKSIVIEEAQTLGVPVVSADCTGISEQIDSGRTGIISGSDPNSLADAVEMLIVNLEVREKISRNIRLKEPDFQEGFVEFQKVLEENG